MILKNRLYKLKYMRFTMQSILVTPRNYDEFHLLEEFLNSKNISSIVLYTEDKEDLGLLQLMNEADRNNQVSRENIMSILE